MEDKRPCPFCREMIFADAIKCKHCGSMLTAAGGPSSSPGTSPGAQSVPGWAAGAAQIPEGTEIREYRVLGLLGEGGMGEVYQAEHTYTGQKVAIKAVHPGLMANQNVRRRFLEEGRVMAGLKHPNIVTLHTFFEEAGRFFLILEFIDGNTLEEALKQGPLDERRAVSVISDVLAGLHYAHTRPAPVIHRDIKPANIMIDHDGRVVITDFGIARAVDREKLTKTGGALGTYEYMSPEQIRGADLDHRADLYSVGITLFQLLRGTVPFPQDSTSGIECMNAHLNASIPDLSTVGVPHVLRMIIERALAKDPAERYGSGAEFRAALMSRPGAADVPSAAAFVPPSGSGRAGTIEPAGEFRQGPAGGGKVLWGVLAGLGFLCVAAAAFWGMGNRGAEAEKQPAVQKSERPSSPVVDPPRAVEATNAVEATTPAVAPTPEMEAACLVDCEAKECGDDGCGGSCGNCPLYHSCSSGRCICTPQCSGKSCGPDSCGASCGTCPPGWQCEGGQCSCKPQCAGKACGPAGCGQSCGICPGNQDCQEGQCVCSPRCSGRSCGSDGCGGSCGFCSSNQTCSDGRCITVHDPCSYEGLSCSGRSYSYSDVEKAQRAVFELRKAGSFSEALCIAGWLEGTGMYMPSMTQGRLFYDAARSWHEKGCGESACTAIRRSLVARPKSGRGFEITCEHCRSWGCPSCNGCE